MHRSPIARFYAGRMLWTWVLVGAYLVANLAVIALIRWDWLQFRRACVTWDDVAHIETHARGTVERGIGLGILHTRTYVVSFHDIEGERHELRQRVSGPWLQPGAHIEVRYPVGHPQFAAVDPRRSRPRSRYVAIWLVVYPVLAVLGAVLLTAIVIAESA